jgi:hypothetical protein
MARVNEYYGAILLICCPAVCVAQVVDPYDHPIAKSLLPVQHTSISNARAAVLTKMGCTIQQFSDSPGLDGVITGAFRASGTKDQAVLCHQRNENVVVVFWEGQDTVSTTVGREPFRAQRQIYLANPAYVIEHLAWYGSDAAGIPKEKDSPSLRARLAALVKHDGISDGSGCCSMTHYWTGKRWAEYPGAD